MGTRSELLESIAETVADYREGEVSKLTPEHIDTWVNQFDPNVQEPILAELDHVFKKTYFSKEDVKEFLAGLVTAKKLVGPDPCSFWKDVEFLKIQGGGNSQREMLEMFDDILAEQCGLKSGDCGKNPAVYLYLDDAVFTGNRVKADLSSWIESDAPAEAKVHVVTIALHSGGDYYARTRIEKSAKTAGKKIEITWWRCINLENRKSYLYSSDVLSPTCLPDDPNVQSYVASLGYPQALRKQGGSSEYGVFSGEEGRHLLEQQFLMAGLHVRQMCPNLPETMRPLGASLLKTFGFGSTIVTFRNCPNNCPLVFWAGDPWYPLFPRSSNSEAFMRRLLKSLRQK